MSNISQMVLNLRPRKQLVLSDVVSTAGTQVLGPRDRFRLCRWSQMVLNLRPRKQLVLSNVVSTAGTQVPGPRDRFFRLCRWSQNHAVTIVRNISQMVLNLRPTKQLVLSNGVSTAGTQALGPRDRFRFCRWSQNHAVTIVRPSHCRNWIALGATNTTMHVGTCKLHNRHSFDLYILILRLDKALFSHAHSISFNLSLDQTTLSHTYSLAC